MFLPSIEMLIHYSCAPDIGLAEAGLAEMIAESVKATHPALHALLYSNIFLTGGTVCHPGFHERVEAELRPLVPDVYEVSINLIVEGSLFVPVNR